MPDDMHMPDDAPLGEFPSDLMRGDSVPGFDVFPHFPHVHMDEARKQRTFELLQARMRTLRTTPHPARRPLTFWKIALLAVAFLFALGLLLG